MARLYPGYSSVIDNVEKLSTTARRGTTVTCITGTARGSGGHLAMAIACGTSEITRTTMAERILAL
jgi:hypothetical protein